MSDENKDENKDKKERLEFRIPIEAFAGIQESMNRALNDNITNQIRFTHDKSKDMDVLVLIFPLQKAPPSEMPPL